MRKVSVQIIPKDVVFEDDIAEETAIFATLYGEYVAGMLVKEKPGWILRSGTQGSYGHWDTRAACIAEGISRGFTFFVDVRLNNNKTI